MQNQQLPVIISSKRLRFTEAAVKDRAYHICSKYSKHMVDQSKKIISYIINLQIYNFIYKFIMNFIIYLNL